ncbi:beta-propeller domain-containing protein [Paenibacillus eucommiae]|uniref:Secreted protein with C-terminal beta-propeller domain n=1 Tax=Paenibacillus eucommiae TaxID=1355755 RepID=A0ABS4IP17_9BACL|nr:beta-propeller domain-containing protein [Paenibacillus eucommiae]MBP1989284.1 putative secreted protein with C-terminal beta-propeller domain [Paenibacillus eucommiae]
MKKMLLWSFLVVVSVSLIATSSWAGESPVKRSKGPIPIEYKGNQLTFVHEPQNKNNHLMVPAKEWGDYLGIQIEWNAQLRTVTSKSGSTTVVWTLGKTEAAGSLGKLALTEAPYLHNEVFMVPLRAFSEAFGFFTLWNESSKSLLLQKEDSDLPIVGSAAKLSALLEQNPQYNLNTMVMKTEARAMNNEMAISPVAESAAPLTGSDTGSATKQKEDSAYSTTNVQVEGVDEGDVVKTDGSYIYQVNRQKIIVSQAQPANEMKVISTLEFPEQSMVPTEIYVDAKHLIVIGNSYISNSIAQPEASPNISNRAEKKMLMPIPNYGKQMVKAIIYDLTDKTKLKNIRELELEGYYISSRKIADSLYLVTNKGIDMQVLQQSKSEDNLLGAPQYRDSLSGDSFTTLSYDRIRYFPTSVTPNYVLVGGIDLSAPEQALQVASYVGSGNNIYASENHLYVAVSEYTNDQPEPQEDAAAKKKIANRGESSQMNTLVYKFMLEKGSVRSVANGKVPGTILNQFAMDEHNGYFRIATTTGEMWRDDEYTSKNNVYILDGMMNLSGKLEGLAPGERIYSTRFMGDRAYMVTFKNVDPLFVLDLKNPQQPNVLGKLKIPGYSDYLHPYDENHLIGFGKDTQEVSIKGDPTNTTAAYYQGMKIALFDVTDVANPIELYKESIGARGTDSELLGNHKALLFDKEKGLLAFPVTVTEKASSSNSTKENEASEYGQFTFQGMYVYNLSLAQGFQLKGKITHLSQEDIAKAGSGWYESDLNIQRGLYIGDVLYTLSRGLIKANKLDSLQEVGQLKLP